MKTLYLDLSMFVATSTTPENEVAFFEQMSIAQILEDILRNCQESMCASVMQIVWKMKRQLPNREDCNLFLVMRRFVFFFFFFFVWFFFI